MLLLSLSIWSESKAFGCINIKSYIHTYIFILLSTVRSMVLWCKCSGQRTERIHFQFNFFPLAPLLGSSPPYWSTGPITQFLYLSQAVGLLERVISSSQGLYLNTGQHKHRKTPTQIKHPCPGRNSNSQSRPPSDRRLSQGNFAHHKSHVTWPWLQPGPPQWEASYGTAYLRIAFTERVSIDTAALV
jgi:hypothetical protein